MASTSDFLYKCVLNALAKYTKLTNTNLKPIFTMSSQKNPIQIALVPSSTTRATHQAPGNPTTTGGKNLQDALAPDATKRTPPQAQGRPSNTRGNLIQSGLATASTTTRATHQAQGNPTTTGGMNTQNGLVPGKPPNHRN
ncbi:hypothetical protein Fmac_004935 [Flemingia macrophylla]|uniref:Uncharacterized protein n=1 Tax=Flemingia macrophylla TaxID=520843 RepID=A0ABD1N6A4_9FABA